MTQFTREHLGKVLDKHFKKIDQRFEKFVTKREFDGSVHNLVTNTELVEQTEALTKQNEAPAAMVQHGFGEVYRRLDVHEQDPRHDRGRWPFRRSRTKSRSRDGARRFSRAFGVMMVAPIVVVFLLFQRWFEQGVASTGLKG